MYEQVVINFVVILLITNFGAIISAYIIMRISITRLETLVGRLEIDVKKLDDRTDKMKEMILC